MTPTDIHWIAEQLADVSSTIILPRFRALDAGQVEAKEHLNDLVTVADQECERELIERFSKQYPDAVLIGEEQLQIDPTQLDLLEGASLAIVIDPIDGTWQFAHGSPAFGILIAIISQGRTVAGINYEPVTGDYFWAIEGQGAFRRVRGKDHAVKITPDQRSLRETIGSNPLKNYHGDDRARVLAGYDQLGRVMDYLCSAIEYQLVCAGGLAYSIHRMNLNCWDHAAGVLIAQEAGAFVALSDGTPYSPLLRKGELVVAESEARFHEIVETLGLGRA